MTRKDITTIPEYFKKYMILIPEELSVVEALGQYGMKYLEPHKEKYSTLGDKVYASGKWTIKQILVHLIDTERIFAYRALRFARGDQTPLAGFEQDNYVVNANTNERSLEDILDEYNSVRASTIHLYKSLPKSKLKYHGRASDNDVSVLALGFMICGHVVHHQKIIKDKYYPLIEN